MYVSEISNLLEPGKSASLRDQTIHEMMWNGVHSKDVQIIFSHVSKLTFKLFAVIMQTSAVTRNPKAMLWRAKWMSFEMNLCSFLYSRNESNPKNNILLKIANKIDEMFYFDKLNSSFTISYKI